MEEQQRNFKGIWIPKEIWLSQELTILEKILLVEIDSLEDEEKGCYASNKYFAEFFKLSQRWIAKIISSLKNKGFIEMQYKFNGKEIEQRYIFIKRPPYPKVVNKSSLGGEEKCIKVVNKSSLGGEEKCKENNININNINNNNKYIVEQLDHVPYKSIVDYMNTRYGTSYKNTTNKTKDLIKARFNEGFTEEDFKIVIDKMGVEWMNTEMQKYLRPETLFGTKFESYLNREVKQKNVFAGMEVDIEDFFKE